MQRKQAMGKKRERKCGRKVRDNG